MKVALFNIENQIAPSLLEEGLELVKNTLEYNLTQPEAGYYHCHSKQPDYLVELHMLPEGKASVKCHCSVFKKSKVCKHAIAASLLLRDQILRNRRSKKRLKNENFPLDDVLQKLKVTELRSFISSYALSHSSFRAEMLAHHLHLIRKPDYQALLMDITPMDKYGSFKLNRNNLKTVRNILSILLIQAQELIKDKAFAKCLQILEATIHHLYRLMIKVPQFQDQLSTELRYGLRLFDVLCHQPMAPRLQAAAITLSFDISNRDGYLFIKGTKPLLLSVEPFILELKDRQTAFQLAEKKVTSDIINPLPWACMVMRWTRIWSLHVKRKGTEVVLKKLLPEMIQEFSQQGEHEDALFALGKFKKEDYTAQTLQQLLLAGLRSARLSGNLKWISSLAYDIGLNYLDPDAWDILFEHEPEQARRLLLVVKSYYPPTSDVAADQFLLHGWSVAGDHQELIELLEEVQNMDLFMQYDSFLIKVQQNRLEHQYSKFILAIRDAYGGTQARQKLGIIFNHLKSIGLYDPVMEKIKSMEKERKDLSEMKNKKIQGFVFDLDGVIVDTALHHFNSWKIVMKDLGAEITEDDDKHTRGASRMESLEYLLQRYDIHTSKKKKDALAARKNEIYLESIQQITPDDLLPGILDFIHATKKAGLSIALGSASKNARSVLQKLEIENLFDAILDGYDAKESKPHPEIFINACRQLHLDPSVVVVFEDAAKGVQAAKGAGCKVVGIGDSTTLADADMVLPGLADSTPEMIIEKLT